MFDKLKQLQQMKGQMDEVKLSLDNIQVRGDIEDLIILARNKGT
jgi:DNA-binding protein YbaB